MKFGDLVIYNDRQVIACCKPAGMPTQEDKSGDASLHRLAQAYCKHDLHVVHRLDRPCSGLVVFAKNSKAAAALSGQFAAKQASKEYYAVVPKGIPPEATLKDKLLKKGNKSHVSEHSDAKDAELSYKMESEIDNYALLRVHPATGRMHQIRAQLAHAGYPIKGDVKYGARRGNRDRSIHLHSHKLTFVHPTKNETIELECPTPEDPVWMAFGQDKT